MKEVSNVLYKEFKTPKIGQFLTPKENGEYIYPSGWENEITPLLILGEDDLFYTYRKPKGVGQINKSRLIKWVPTQMSLF